MSARAAPEIVEIRMETERTVCPFEVGRPLFCVRLGEDLKFRAVSWKALKKSARNNLAQPTRMYKKGIM